MSRYPEKTAVDEQFYQDHIKSRIPGYIFDVHVHINLPEHVKSLPESRIQSDWAIESGHILTCEEAYAAAAMLFPDAEYRIAGFPWPIREADLAGNNRYLAEKRREGLLDPFMTVRPQWPAQEVEQALLEGGFAGFKPYPDMFSGMKGADISIFDFMPHEHWEVLNRHQKAVMMHLPRKLRLADDDNIRELLEARDRYPDAVIIIAHFGRCFCPWYLQEGLRKLGDPQGFYFDTSAVINPEVYDMAFSELDASKILYGTDMPILLWHGKREWTLKEYRNLCREPFSWNIHRKSPEEEQEYTFFLYEQMRSILDAAQRNRLSREAVEGIFARNAEKALGLVSGSSA